MATRLSVTYCLNRLDDLMLAVVDRVKTSSNEPVTNAERAEVAVETLIDDMGYLPKVIICEDNDNFWRRAEIIDKRYFMGFIDIDNDFPSKDRDESVYRAFETLIRETQQDEKHPEPPENIKRFGDS